MSPFITLECASRERQICIYLGTGPKAFPAYVTFVMYPKAETSRNVERQGKEPDVCLWGGLGRFLAQLAPIDFEANYFPQGCASSKGLKNRCRERLAVTGEQPDRRQDHRAKGGA